MDYREQISTLHNVAIYISRFFDNYNIICYNVSMQMLQESNFANKNRAIARKESHYDKGHQRKSKGTVQRNLACTKCCERHHWLFRDL